MEIKVPCALEHLTEIRDFVSRSLAECALTTREKSLLVAAVDELCANIIIHGNGQDAKMKLQLGVKKLTKQVKISTCDQGGPFDRSDYHSKSIGQLVEARARGGLGLVIIAKATDSFNYERRNGRNYFSLVKNLNI